MWVPLVVLAVLATVGGFVGISPAFTGGHHVGGRLNIVNWLDPIVWNPATHEFGGVAGEPSEHGAELLGAKAAVTTEHEAVHAGAYGSVGFNLAHAVESKLGGETATEWLFIVISLLVAGTGRSLDCSSMLRTQGCQKFGRLDFGRCTSPVTTSTGLTSFMVGRSPVARWMRRERFLLSIQK